MDFKFKVGDRVIGIGEYQTVNVDGQTGKVVMRVFNGNYNWYKVRYDKKFDRRLHGNDGMCWDTGEDSLEFENKELYLKKKKEKEEKWIKNMENDPFGEETWEAKKYIENFEID